MRGVNVLVIDDEEEARFILRLSLERIGGMTVIEATGGEEGLGHASLVRPDVILLDVNMPGLDGMETFRALRANDVTSAIPIVFLTGQARKGDVEHLTRLGPAGILRKPFNPLTLAQELRDLLAS
jgi:CheY-like chemotaxis protein